MDAFGRPSVPIELKVLGCLRVLGKGYHFDGIAELSGMSEPPSKRRRLVGGWWLVVVPLCTSATFFPT